MVGFIVYTGIYFTYGTVSVILWCLGQTKMDRTKTKTETKIRTF